MNKHVVTIDGVTFTRNSKRVYTHVVIAKNSIKEARALGERQGRAAWERDQEYHRSVVAGTALYATPENKEFSKRWLSLGAEGLAEEYGDRYVASIQNTKSTSDPDVYYTVKGWTGRLDLATRLASPGDIILSVNVV